VKKEDRFRRDVSVDNQIKTRREFLKIVGFGATAVAVSGLDFRRSSTRLPNIVIILPDDQS
jgi:hypothetical protein